MKRLILSTIVIAAPVFAADPADVLKEADRAFAGLSAKQGPNAAFQAFAAPDVTLLNAAQPHVTPEQLGKRFPPDLQIAWEPDEAVISAGGDLGYTMGHATITSGGKAEKSRYLTVWRKQPDGSWKFILDGGVPQP
jgi:ketosteroid isomerase-like protein